VPKPIANLTRFHCVFALNSKQRAQVTQAKRGLFDETGCPLQAEHIRAAASPARQRWRLALWVANEEKRAFERVAGRVLRVHLPI
jgi:hypothetical protein